MALVLSTHPLHPQAAELISAAATLRVAPSLLPEHLVEAAREADIIIVRAPIPSALFGHAARLRAAIRHGAGVDMIPLEAATNAGVLVVTLPGLNAQSVAEYVIFSALALARRFRSIDRDLRLQGWSHARDQAIRTTELSGKTLGLVGMGNVGRAIYELAHAFNMSVIASKPNADAVPAGVTFKPLEVAIAESDFLVLCCPLTEATRGLMTRARIALMKPTAFLINAARGPIVVEADLLEALDSGSIAGVALDVFAQQPLPPDHPLLHHENVLLTPHIAGITSESMYRMGIGAARETLRVLRGDLPENVVNPNAVTAYRARFSSLGPSLV